MKKRNTWMKKFIKTTRRTWKNKLCAIALLIIGALATSIDGDATMMVFLMIIGTPLFLAKENLVD